MLNDDLISAYLDGELDAERRAMVEQHLRFDSGAAARFERLRAADNMLKLAFPVSETKNGDVLATAILSGETPKNSDWRLRAASFAAAMLLGLLVGSFVNDHDQRAFALSQQQVRLLDTQLSGRVTDTEEGAFEVVLSLRSDGGDVCRQFRLTRNMESTDVLACRTGDETWRMVAAASALQVEGYTPAGANSPLDAAIENLGGVEALDATQEAALVADGWQ